MGGHWSPTVQNNSSDIYILYLQIVSWPWLLHSLVMLLETVAWVTLASPWVSRGMSGAGSGSCRPPRWLHYYPVWAQTGGVIHHRYARVSMHVLYKNKHEINFIISSNTAILETSCYFLLCVLKNIIFFGIYYHTLEFRTYFFVIAGTRLLF